MPATVRDILLVIRAKEEASRAINQVSRSMTRAAASSSAASARARASASRAQAQQAMVRAEMYRTQAAQARLNGATREEIAALQEKATAQRRTATELRNSAAASDENARNIQEADRQAQGYADRLHSVAQGAQLAGVALIAMGTGGLLALNNAVGVAAEWDRQVRMTFTQVDKRYKPSLAELGDIGVRVASKIATPFEGIQDALFDVFSSTEANMPQAEKLLESFAKAAVAGQTDIQTVSRATIGLMNSYKIPFQDVNKVLDIQFQLVQEGVGTYQEWAARIGLVSPSAARAGQSIETMAAALSTATRSGMSAARAGTSVARAFDAMSNPKTEASLKEIGVRTRDASGNFRPLVAVMGDWKKALDKLPKADRVKSLLGTLAGAGSTIEARRFLQNILLTKGGLELFQDQVKEFSTDKGAFERGYAEMADSVSAKTQALHNSWMVLKLAIGQALLPAFTQVVGIVQKAVNWFNGLPEATKRNVAQFALWGSVLSIVGGAFAVLMSIVIGFTAVIASAGAALAPMAATIAGIVGTAALVAAGIIALGAAFVIAYQRVAPFRELVNAVGALLMSLVEPFIALGRTIMTIFMTYVWPPLVKLGQVIANELLPVLTDLVNWFRAEIVPSISRVVAYIGTMLIPLFKLLGAIISQALIPLIRNLISVWNNLLPVIHFVIKALVLVGEWLLKIAVWVVAQVIRALLWFIKVVVQLANIVVSAINRVINVIKGMVSGIGSGVSKAVSWFKKMGTSAAKTAAEVIKWFGALPGRITAALSGAASMLAQVGRDMISGLISGVKDMAGDAIGAVKDVVSDAWSGAKDFLGIHSPSKLYRDIGKNTIQGMINGINGSRKALISSTNSLLAAVVKSIEAAKISKKLEKAMEAKWINRIEKAQSKLLKLYDKRAALQTRLVAAETRYNDLLKERADLFSKVRDAVLQSGDLSTLDDAQKASATGIAAGLKERLQALQTFQAQLASLGRRGLDKQVIADLASQGVEASGSIVDALFKATPGDIATINSYERQIRTIANATGNNVADSMYKQGINAAKGLADGLKSQIKTITASMTSIANALIRQIKKSLGIKSPSKVLAAIGVNTAKGYINGYTSQMNKNTARMGQMSLFSPGAGYAGRVASGSSAYGDVNPGKTFNQHITIHTQEIDPVKNAADLGWELTGRIN